MRYQKHKFDAEQDKINLFSKQFGISPLIMKIIMSRGFKTKEDIDNFLYAEKLPLQNPMLLSGIFEAVVKIRLAITKKENILIFGDYDVDGVSATAIMLKTLKELGANASYFLPNRFIDGYGLTCNAIDKIKKKFNPSLIITVDCGISCKNEIAYAKTKGIEIIVTDHHEIPPELPETICINPKIAEQQFTFKHLCGTGVAYKLSCALIGEKSAQKFLPIVAIATIADIVPLIGENRVLIKKAKTMMGQLPKGLRYLFQINNISPETATAHEIAFKIAPKLNASGRMGDAGDSLELYFETDLDKIKKLAQKIIKHNQKRQAICASVYDDCVSMLSKIDLTEKRVIVLYSKNWDQGILGIVASKIADEFCRPCFLFSEIENEILKGSARSVQGINIHKMIAMQSNILETYGGHSSAAGLALKKEFIQLFENNLEKYIKENISENAFLPTKFYDEDLQENEINEELFLDLQKLEPTGCENLRPIFCTKPTKTEIIPMKRFPEHANVSFGKITLAFFSYISKKVKLSLCKYHNFYYEIENRQKGMFKGTLKDVDSSLELTETAGKFLNPLKIIQLKGCAGEAKFKYYVSEKLYEFVADCSLKAFGTAFVCFGTNEFLNFTNKFDLSNINEFCCHSTPPVNGLNAIVLFPESFEFLKNYKRVVFLDQVLDEVFIAKINQITNAEIFVLSDKKFDKKTLFYVKNDKKTLAEIFGVLKKICNRKFSDVFDMFTYAVRNCGQHNDFASFYFALLVESELGVFDLTKTSGFWIITQNKNIKTDLSNSSIWNAHTSITEQQYQTNPAKFYTKNIQKNTEAK
ncbi:MAG: single-stranded-DNA-specific exonuclease RecJ [Clostridia bacterium]